MTKFEPILSIPERMGFWEKLIIQPPSQDLIEQHGQVALVDIRPAHLEQAHEVYLVDERGNPFGTDPRDLGLVALACFFYPGGDEAARFALRVGGRHKDNAWPHIISGNPQVIDFGGYARHTTGAGGESIKVVLYDRETLELVCPSPMVHGCHWADSSNLVFDVRGNRHHGVALKFQVQRLDRLKELEKIYSHGHKGET